MSNGSTGSTSKWKERFNRFGQWLGFSDAQKQVQTQPVTTSGGTTTTGSSTTTGTGTTNASTAGGPILVEDAQRFKSFVLVPLPPRPPDQYARDDDRTDYIDKLARKIADTLRQENFLNFDLLEIYMTPASKGILMELLRGGSGFQVLEQRIAGQVRTVRQQRQQQQGASPALPQQIYLVTRALEFDPTFDALLGSIVLVRPLTSGGAHIPKEPTQEYRDVAQILLGEVIILDEMNEELGREEIWAWRKVQREGYFTLHVDFDLLHRAFPSRLRPFPLGIEIRFSMDVSKHGKRKIDEVILNIKEARQWSQVDDSPVGRQVQYYIETGDRHYRDNPLLSLPDDQTIKANIKPEPYELGKDRTNRPILAQIVRDFVAVAERPPKTFRYLFYFFERGHNFTPKNNTLRLSGQFISATEKTTVYLPPTLEKEPVPLFTLNPQQGGGFVLENLGQPLRTKNHGDIQPSQSCSISIGEEIQLISAPVGGVAPDQAEFRLKDLQNFPSEVLQAKNYAAFLEVQSTETSSLVAEEYSLGAGDFFPRDSSGLGAKALVFKRNWTRVSMEAGPGQVIWYVKDTPGVNLAERLSEEPMTLELNDYYRIYLGDFQLKLDLTPTPEST